MEKKNYNIESFRELAKSVAWECLSKKYVNRLTKLIFKCPEGHTQEIAPFYFKDIVENNDGKCFFCHGTNKQKNSLHWLIQELSYHGLEKELFSSVIEEAHERYAKDVELLKINFDTQLKKYKKELLEKEFQGLLEKRKNDIKELNENLINLEQKVLLKNENSSKLNEEIDKLHRTLFELNERKSEAIYDIEQSYRKGINMGIAMGLENCEKYLHAKNTRLYGNADDSNYIIYFMKIISVEEMHFRKRNEYYETTYGHIK